MSDKRVSAERTESGGIVTCNIEGTFNRRVSGSSFEDVVGKLRADPVPDKLIINLSDIAALDSKGEGEIETTLGDTLSNGGRAALVIDPTREYLYVALETIVGELDARAAMKNSREDAVAFVQGKS